MERIDFDSAAATPVDASVSAVMHTAEQEYYANPGSLHRAGEEAHSALERARSRIAQDIGAKSHEIIFTSGGTEGNNLALFGSAYGMGNPRGTIITSTIEHSSIREALRELERRGCTIVELPVDTDGRINPRDLADTLTPDTFLITIHLAHNEIGTIQSIREISRIVREYSRAHARVYPYLHSDACQAPRTLSTMVETLGVDLMTVSGAKIYGPRGTGFLYVREGTNCSPLHYGGGQEYGLRSGTQDVAHCIGLAEAFSLATSSRKEEAERLSLLRTELCEGLLSLSGTVLNSPRHNCLPQIVNVSFKQMSGERMVLELDRRGIAAATGSACSSRTRGSSHIIRALSNEPWRVEGAVRFSLPRFVTRDHIVTVLDAVSDILHTCTTFHR